MRQDSPYRRPDRREQRRARTRTRIFDEAIAAFRQVGFETASVVDIARAAKVSRPSFYAHFPTKEHVLLEFQWQLEQAIVEAIARVASPCAAVHEFVDRLVATQDAVGDDELFRDILQFWARPPAVVTLMEHRFPCVEEVARRFADRAREAPLPLPPDRAALLFLAGVFGYLLGAGGSRKQRAEDLHALATLHLGERAAPPRRSRSGARAPERRVRRR